MNAEFTRQYAIRMPDGALYSRPAYSSTWASLFGDRGSGGNDDQRIPQVWDSRESADSALSDMRKRAADLGVGDWFGVVVQRLCTPFTSADPGERLVSELQTWLSEQGDER